MFLFEIDYISSCGGCFVFESRTDSLIEAAADLYRMDNELKEVSNVTIKR